MAQSGPILVLSPGVVFLDVQMPGGFEVLRAAPSENLPSRIGLMAYEQHACCTFKFMLRAISSHLWRNERFSRARKERAR